MIILKQLYIALEQHLNAVQNIKKIDWYNEQYSNMKEERATRFPVVYLEFDNTINWLQSGDKFQYADINITLHCVVYDIKDDPIEALTFAQNVYDIINNKVLYDTDDFQLTTPLVRSSSTLPKRYNQLKVCLLDFTCRIFDKSNMPDLQDAGNVNFTIN